MMAYHIYKCNRAPTNGPDTGDWMAHVFVKRLDGSWRWKDGRGWGRYKDHPELMRLNSGDLIIALQTGTRKKLIGLAEHVGDVGSGSNRCPKLRPLELINVSIPLLKKADPKGVGSIDALQGGKQQALYPITTADAKLLLRAARLSREVADDAVAMKAAERTVSIVKKVAAVGAGFGDSETNRKVERAAVRAVVLRLRHAGWIIRSAESEKLGYDLDCGRGAENAHVEVKGIQGSMAQFFITAKEVACWRKDPVFRLAVVTSALAKPTVMFFTRSDLSRFRIENVLYRAILT
jgi:hypothetical protein